MDIIYTLYNFESYDYVYQDSQQNLISYLSRIGSRNSILFLLCKIL